MLSDILQNNLIPLLFIQLRVAIFLAGLTLVLRTLVGAIRSFVLPRGEVDEITFLVFLAVRRLFELRLRWANSFHKRDRIMALYSPVSLLILPPIWLTLVHFGYMGMFWALDMQPLSDLFLLSGSLLLTWGFASVRTLPQMILAFTEATIPQAGLARFFRLARQLR